MSQLELLDMVNNWTMDGEGAISTEFLSIIVDVTYQYERGYKIIKSVPYV